MTEEANIPDESLMRNMERRLSSSMPALLRRGSQSSPMNNTTSQDDIVMQRRGSATTTYIQQEIYKNRRGSFGLPQRNIYSIPLLTIDAQGKEELIERTMKELLNDILKESGELDQVLIIQKEMKLSSRRGSTLPTTDSLPTSSSSTNLLQAAATGSLNNPPTTSDESVFISGLRLRDLRRLDFHANPDEEQSLVMILRRHVILLIMDPIRAVILSNKLYVFLPPPLLQSIDQSMQQQQQQQSSATATAAAASGASSKIIVDETIHPMISQFMSHTERSDKELLAFEYQAIDALFRTYLAMEREKLVEISEMIEETLHTYYYTKSSHTGEQLLHSNSSIILPIQVQDTMRIYKNVMSLLAERIEQGKQFVLQMTEDDSEMALMNVSYLRTRIQLYKLPLSQELLQQHEAMEELLESHLIDFHSLEMQIHSLQSQIQNSEDSMSIKLDTTRNDLLVANTGLVMISCGIAFGGYIAGIFGMNLNNTVMIQSTPNSFVEVTICSFVAIFITILILYGYLKYTNILPERISKSLAKAFLFRSSNSRRKRNNNKDRRNSLNSNNTNTNRRFSLL